MLSVDKGLLILRLGSGLMMLFAHGLPKLMNFGHLSKNFADPIGLGPLISVILAIFSEFICALLIAVGFKTRLAAIPLIITMLVAAFIVHVNDPFSKQEFPLLYAVCYLVLVFTGSGKYSVDHKLSDKKA